VRVHLFAGARPWERPHRPVRHAFRGQGLANLTLPGLAALIPHHHDVRLQDEQVAPLDLDAPIDLAMVTTKACYTPRAYEIADALRDRGVPVVIGGCHASLNPEEAAGHADAVVTGEAESVMPALLEDAARGRLEPRYKGTQADMARVPVPRRELLQKRYITDSLIVSRGCNYSCRFCCIRGFYGPGFRAKPVGQVVDEVRGLGTYLSFLDEKRAIPFLEELASAVHDEAKRLTSLFAATPMETSSPTRSCTWRCRCLPASRGVPKRRSQPV